MRFSATVEPAGNATGSRFRQRLSTPSGPAAGRRWSSRSAVTPGAAGSRPWAAGSFRHQRSQPRRRDRRRRRGEVGLRLDAEPRLADALDAPQARAAFDRLPMASSASTCGHRGSPEPPDAAAAHRQADHHDRRRPRCLAVRHRARRPSARCRPPRAGSTAEPASGFEDADFQDLNGGRAPMEPRPRSRNPRPGS